MSSRRARLSPRPTRTPVALEVLEDRRLLTTVWGPQEITTGKDLVASNYVGLTGAGTSIAIIDTGVDYNHPALGGDGSNTALKGFGPGHKVVGGYDFVDNDADPMDTSGHGTGVAAVAAGLPFTYGGKTYQGVAPGADVIALRIDAGNYGWNKEAPLAEKALQWVIDNAATYNIVAVNMSFGKGHYATDDVVDPSYPELADEFATLKAMGIVLVSSSGNDGLTQLNGIEYPGADPNVYSIGATYPDGSIWEQTERGVYMDLLAPGANIVIPYFDVATHTHIYITGAYGTSFAAPWAAGMAALLKQLDPTIAASDAMSIMKSSGVTKSDSTGSWKLLNINSALALAYAQRDDAQENNDSSGAAKALSFGGGDTASLSDLKLLQGDADWFKFTLGATADVDWALTLDYSGAGPQVDLIDVNGTVIKRLAATDHIRLSAGTYFLRVNAPAESLGGTYGISVTQTPDDGADNQTPATASPITLGASGGGSVSDMTLLGGVPDYYSFTIDGVRDVNLAISYGGSSPMPAGQLLDTNGNLLANFASDGTLSRRLAAGRYLIKVGASATVDGTYGVVVSTASTVTPGTNGSSNGIAYDAAGRLYLAYYDEVAKNLKFAVRDAAGVWGSVTTVDAGFMAGQFVSLALDSLGHAGIAYYDANNADLKYAHFNGSSWDVQTVDAQFTTGYYPSLRYGAGDAPVISYYSKTSGDLRFAAWTGAAWALSTIDSAGDVGRYSSLAFNLSSGRWSVAYEDTGHGIFKYADQGKSGWGVATVDAGTRIGGGYISLAFSAKTKLASMSYYDAYNADLKFASFNGSRWSTQSIATKGTVGLYSSLRIDPGTGLADILYYNKGGDTVMRASQSGGGAFSLSQVTTDGGRWISRALDADGVETLAYLSGSDVAVVEL